MFRRFHSWWEDGGVGTVCCPPNLFFPFLACTLPPPLYYYPSKDPLSTTPKHGSSPPPPLQCILAASFANRFPRGRCHSFRTPPVESTDLCSTLHSKYSRPLFRKYSTLDWHHNASPDRDDGGKGPLFRGTRAISTNLFSYPGGKKTRSRHARHIGISFLLFSHMRSTVLSCQRLGLCWCESQRRPFQRLLFFSFFA